MSTITEHVDTLELREGDVVWHHGMRLQLGTRNEGGYAGRSVVWFTGTVLNQADVTGTDGRAVWPLTGLLYTDGPAAYTWTVQGNALAHWSREVTVPVTA